MILCVLLLKHRFHFHFNCTSHLIMTTKNEKKIEGIDRDKVEYTDAERETV